jgi:hypothetical protein
MLSTREQQILQFLLEAKTAGQQVRLPKSLRRGTLKTQDGARVGPKYQPEDILDLQQQGFVTLKPGASRAAVEITARGLRQL